MIDNKKEQKKRINLYLKDSTIDRAKVALIQKFKGKYNSISDMVEQILCTHLDEHAV